MNCQRLRNELRKIFRALAFINGKNQRIQVCRVWLSPKRPVICVEREKREQQIAGAKAKGRNEQSEHLSLEKLPCGCVWCICHYPHLPESINTNDGWKYFFSLTTFHFTNWWTKSPPKWCEFPLNVLFSSKHERSLTRERGQCLSVLHLP